MPAAAAALLIVLLPGRWTRKLIHIGLNFILQNAAIQTVCVDDLPTTTSLVLWASASRETPYYFIIIFYTFVCCIKVLCVWLLDLLTLQAFCPKLWHWLALRWLITMVSKGLMPLSAVGDYWQLWPPLLMEPLLKALFVALWTLSHLSSCAIDLGYISTLCTQGSVSGIDNGDTTGTPVVIRNLDCNGATSLEACQFEVLSAPDPACNHSQDATLECWKCS